MKCSKRGKNVREETQQQLGKRRDTPKGVKDERLRASSWVPASRCVRACARLVKEKEERDGWPRSKPNKRNELRKKSEQIGGGGGRRPEA